MCVSVDLPSLITSTNPLKHMWVSGFVRYGVLSGERISGGFSFWCGMCLRLHTLSLTSSSQIRQYTSVGWRLRPELPIWHAFLLPIFQSAFLVQPWCLLVTPAFSYSFHYASVVPWGHRELLAVSLSLLLCMVVRCNKNIFFLFPACRHFHCYHCFQMRFVGPERFKIINCRYFVQQFHRSAWIFLSPISPILFYFHTG